MGVAYLQLQVRPASIQEQKAVPAVSTSRHGAQGTRNDSADLFLLKDRGRKAEDAVW